MDKNQNNLSLENALRTAKLLRPLSPQAKNELFRTKNEGDFQGFQKVAFENRLDPNTTWEGIGDLQQQMALGQNIEIENTPGVLTQPNEEAQGRRGLGIGSVAASSGLLFVGIGSYEDAKKIADYHANIAVSQWEQEEIELKKSGKTPPSGRARSKEEAYERAENNYHDRLVRENHHRARRWASKNPDDIALGMAIDRRELQQRDLTYDQFKIKRDELENKASRYYDNRPLAERAANMHRYQSQARSQSYDILVSNSPEKAEEWALVHNDPELQEAIERKRLTDEEKRNSSRIRKGYHKTGLDEKVAKAKTKFKNSKAGKLAESINNKYKKLTDTPARTKDYLAQTKIGKLITRINKKINHVFGAPGRQYDKFKKWASQTRLGKTYTKITGAPGKFKKRLAGTKLGRLTGKLNKATKRIKNLLNPLNYLLNLIKKSIIRSIITAAISGLTSVISLAVTITVGIVTGAIGIFSAAVGLVIATVGIPGIIVILIVVLLALVFVLTAPCVIFCDQETRTFIDSPYPGIGYSITAPETIQNEENITYSIFVLFDEAKATSSIDDLTVYSKIPPGTSFVSATGNYNLSGSDISWKLYPENKTPDFDNQIVHTFTFTLIVDPVDDIVVSNTLSLNASSNSPPPLPGNTAYNEDTCNGKYRYIKDNDLLPYNFGDPECTLDTFAKRDSLYRLLKQKDAKWADFWFNVIIPGESGYRPNAWYLCGSNPWSADDPRCTPNPRGAWGLFQMGSSRPPGSSENRIGGRGDVTWQEQVDNAIQRNRGNELLGLLFRYWQVAIEWCRDGNMSKPQCKDM